MLRSLLSRWPLIEQIRTGADGTGPEAMSQRTRELLPRITMRRSRAPSAPIAALDVDSLSTTNRASSFPLKGTPSHPFRAGIFAPRGRTPSNCTRTQDA